MNAAASPMRAERPTRPEGDLGIRIVVTIDGVPRALWLGHSRRPASATGAVGADLFRTPVDAPLGVPVGAIIDSLLDGTALENELPDALATARVDRLELTRAAGHSRLSFALEIALVLGDSTLRAWLQFGRRGRKWFFATLLRIGDPDDPVEVTLTLDTAGNFSARMQQDDTAPKRFSLASLGSIISPELAEMMGHIEISPRRLLFASHRASGNHVLALDVAADLSLSRLPFVGDRLPAGADIGIREMSLFWCSEGLAEHAPARAVLGTLLAEDAALLDAGALVAGGRFRASLTVPPDTLSLDIPLHRPAGRPSTENPPVSPRRATPSALPAPGTAPSANPSTSPSTAVSPAAASPAVDAPVTWVKVGRKAGPLNLARVGFRYENRRLWMLFDAAVNADPVTLIVDGLGAGLDTSELLAGRFDPSFTLRGLGLAIKGPAEIGGAFLRDRVTSPRGDYDEFSGVMRIRTELLSVSGMGSYADPPWGDPSLFAYAFLDKPIGGPAFFFVTGLALGIAVNRTLDLPPLEAVSDFPLVRLALGESLTASGTPPGTSPDTSRGAVRDTGGDAELTRLLEVQQAMKPFVRPASGQLALAVGVRFTTFNLVESLALLVASFARPVTIDLLVSSRLRIPSRVPGNAAPPPAIAEIGIDLRGTLVPEDGTVRVEGRITPGSWFLDSACRLSGGAAFAAWGSGPHAGDFVMSVGGYHPEFAVPAHYPVVPRLALDFRRDALTIKGEAYFAMTPSALMAGGSLSAIYADGDARAWFDCGADFLVAWEPFGYEASMHIEVGASCRTELGTLSASVGASLSLWGPDLAGIATIDLTLFTIEIEFGAPKALPAPLDAAAFRERFLPAEDAALLAVKVTDGLLRTGTHRGTPLFVVNPAEFVMVLESAVPSPDGEHVGIGPMGRTALAAREVLDWHIDRDPSSFRSERIRKPVPAALWAPAPRPGAVRAPGLGAGDAVIDAVVGHALRPARAPKAGTSREYDVVLLESNPDTWRSSGDGTRTDPVWPDAAPVFEQSTTDVAAVLGRLAADPPRDLLEALAGETLDVDEADALGTDWLDDLQELPRVGTLGSAP